MKLLSIIALFTLCTIVRGWVAYLQPIVLTIGAAFTALYNDAEPILDIQPFKLPKWLSVYKNSKDNDDEDERDEGGEFKDLTVNQGEYHYPEWDADAAKKEFTEYLKHKEKDEKLIAKGWMGPEENLSESERKEKAEYMEKWRKELGTSEEVYETKKEDEELYYEPLTQKDIDGYIKDIDDFVEQEEKDKEELERL